MCTDTLICPCEIHYNNCCINTNFQMVLLLALYSSFLSSCLSDSSLLSSFDSAGEVSKVSVDSRTILPSQALLPCSLVRHICALTINFIPLRNFIRICRFCMTYCSTAVIKSFLKYMSPSNGFADKGLEPGIQ